MYDRSIRVLMTAAGMALLTACGGGSSNSISDGGPEEGGGGEPGVQQRVVDARTETSYLNLDTGELTAADGDWHLAFNRMNVMVNGGASGNGRVAGAMGNGQVEFYGSNGEPDPNVFLNASPGPMLSSLLADFAAPGDWTSDSRVSAFGDMYAWSAYDMATGVVRELPGVGYLVRSDTGESYARMRVVEFSFPTRAGNGIESFRIEFEVQAAGTEQFSGNVLTFETPAGFDGGDACFDFDSNVVVDCVESDDWDVQLGFSGRGWYLRSNSGPSGAGAGGALGPMDWSELADFTSATTAVNGTSLDRAYLEDTTSGIFTDYPWYAYNLQSQHKLWPNYRVYLINTDTDSSPASVYAVQITSYYGEDNQSGQPLMRWVPVNLTEGEE